MNKGIAELRAGILSVEAMPLFLAASIAAEVDKYDWKKSTVAEVRGLSKIEYVAEDVRHCDAIGEYGASQLIKEVLEVVGPKALQSFNEYWGMNFTRLVNPQFTKYEQGHFIRVHTDDGAAFPLRVGSVVVYLTDDYLGGEISFPKFDLAIRPRAGTALIFPSDYVHEVRKVEHGIKKIFLFFIEADART